MPNRDSEHLSASTMPDIESWAIRSYRRIYLDELLGNSLVLAESGRFKSGDVKGTIRRVMRRLLVSTDVRRHRLISISYISQICHGRGRGFESRRPRHSYQKSCLDFFETNEGAKGCIPAPILHPFPSIEPFSRERPS